MNRKVIFGKYGWAVALFICFAVKNGFGAYVMLPNGTQVVGTDIRAKSNGEIVLTTPQGQRSFFPGQYTKAVADKPADFDKARQAIASKNFDEAIRLLDDIAQKYRFLDWDNQARALLAKVHLAKGDAASAADVFEQMFRTSPAAKNDPAVMWPYRETLLASKQYDKLAVVLDEAIAKGTRADAAKAQVMRGDIKMAQGQLEGAVFDYLRTVILFESEKDVQPEALFKAADGLEKLRDARAKDLYAKLTKEYPGTPYAEKAAGK